MKNMKFEFHCIISQIIKKNAKTAAKELNNMEAVCICERMLSAKFGRAFKER